MAVEREKLGEAIAGTQVTIDNPADDVGASVGMHVLGYAKPNTSEAPRWDWLKWDRYLESEFSFMKLYLMY